MNKDNLLNFIWTHCTWYGIWSCLNAY